MLICPFCGRELDEGEKKGGGWECQCGEFIPEGLACDPSKQSCGCNKCK